MALPDIHSLPDQTLWFPASDTGNNTENNNLFPLRLSGGLYEQNGDKAGQTGSFWETWWHPSEYVPPGACFQADSRPQDKD